MNIAVNCSTAPIEEIERLLISAEESDRANAAAALASLLTSNDLAIRRAGDGFLRKACGDAFYQCRLNYGGLMAGFSDPFFAPLSKASNPGRFGPMPWRRP